jgi:hypothetical protein
MESIKDKLLLNLVAEIKEFSEKIDRNNSKSIWICLRCNTRSFGSRCTNCSTDEYSVIYFKDMDRIFDLRRNIEQGTQNLLAIVKDENKE